MKVALDATAVTAQPSGARTRLIQLYTRMAKFPDVDLTIFAREDSGLEPIFQIAGVRVETLSAGPSRLTRASRTLNPLVRLVERDEDFTLFDAQTLPLPRIMTIPQVATIHDLRFLEKGLAPWPMRILARWLNVRRTRYIITISHFMRGALLAAFPFLEGERVRVVANSVPFLMETEDDPAVLERLGVKPPYFLCLGHLEPRKNLANLVQAFARFKRSDARAAPFSLVLAGAGTPPAGAFHLGPVSEEERTVLLKNACCSVLPSRYEGFGMGVLEAFAAGTVVACSSIPAHQEVAGDGALFFKPDDQEGMVQAMTRAAFDEKLQDRLRARGRERAVEFSWDQAAVQLHEIWQSC